MNYAKNVLRIPNFRGVFMIDGLPYNGPHGRESAIVNFDGIHGPGTHWVCYKKRGKRVLYFDSFGDLKPPPELMMYLGRKSIIEYNTKRYQWNSYNCGHLCLRFLSENI